MKVIAAQLITLYLLLLSAPALLAQQLPPHAAEADSIRPLLIGQSLDLDALHLTDMQGQSHTLKALGQGKPTVLLVYRGQWCPICSRHFAELGEISDELKALGYTLLALSPDAKTKMKAIAEEGSDPGFAVYSDAKFEVSQALGLLFQAPKTYKPILKKASEKQNPGIIPVPAIYLLDEEGTVLFSYVNPNYKLRARAELVLAAAQVAAKQMQE